MSKSNQKRIQETISILKKHVVYDKDTVVKVKAGGVYVNKNLPVKVLNELTR